MTKKGATILRIQGVLTEPHDAGSRPPRERGGRQTANSLSSHQCFATVLKVEPEVASKIQARARERGVSVDVYLRELINQTGTESERSIGLGSQDRVRMLREWASGHSANTSLLSADAINRDTIYRERG